QSGKHAGVTVLFVDEMAQRFLVSDEPRIVSQPLGETAQGGPFTGFA
ncbi:MAG: hypothetical protein ACI8T1_004229, partial [Verrucomicrobiales bacterium]